MGIISSDVFENFVRHRDYLVCIDSDGCTMDTMDIKHIRCFGPCMIKEWELELWQNELQRRWNEINLYTMTRGINRFLGLELALIEVDRNYKKIEDLESLIEWIESADELSNENLKQRLQKKKSLILEKTLNWSNVVNRWVLALPEEEKIPFGGVEEGIFAIHKIADVAVVSSANRQAIIDEWNQHHLLEHTDVILSQDSGSKAYCIGKLLEKGYEKSRVLMIGDAPGDREAARNNGILYFPILVKKEEESWKHLREEGMDKLIHGTFAGKYQMKLIEAFEKNLSSEQ